MLFTKIQPQSFLGPEEEDSLSVFFFLTIYFGHGGHLVQYCKTIGINDQTPLTKGPMYVKSAEN